MMLQLSNEAVMGSTLSILVQEMMKLGRDLQRTNPQPQREHYRHDRETAVVAPTLCCRRKLHAEG
jgi:hypothetical protein